MPLLASAQNNDKNLLPDINPQDIEIRGDYRISFPGLRRQPVLGFNPKPRIYRIDPNRLPFLETPEQVAANIPVSYLDRPAPPPKYFMDTPNRNHYYIQAGIGSYVSPEITAWVDHWTNDVSNWTARLNYLSFGDYDTLRTSSFQSLEAKVGYRTYLNETDELVLGLSFKNRFHYLFVGTNLESLPGSFSTAPNLLKTLSEKKEQLGGGLEIEFKRQKNAANVTEIGAGIAFRGIDAGDFATLVPGSLGGVEELTAVSFNAKFFKQWAGATIGRVNEVELFGQGTSINADGDIADQTPFLTGLSFRAMSINAWELNWQFGAQVYLLDDEVESNVRIFPDMTILYRFSEALTTQLWAGGHARSAGITWHDRLPYLMLEALLLNESFFDFGAQADYKKNIFQIGVKVQYFLYQDFVQAAASPKGQNRPGAVAFEPLLILEKLDDVGVFRPSLEVVLTKQKSSLEWRTEAYLQEIDADRATPFLESVGLMSSLRWNPYSSLFIYGSGRYIGDRDAFGGTELDTFLKLDAKIEYLMQNRWGLYLRADNILDEDYFWFAHYQELPQRFAAGVTFNF